MPDVAIRRPDRSTGIICDQTIALNGYYSSRDYPHTAAPHPIQGPETGKRWCS
jgi:hypothetical protein